MDEKYKQVACTFYDKLEEYATFKKELKISYAEEGEEITDAIIVIKTLETKNKEEFLITTNDLRIRLDKVLSLVEVEKTKEAMEKYHCKVCYKGVKKPTEKQIKTGKIICKSCEQSGKKLMSCQSCGGSFDKLSTWGFCQQCEARS